MLSVYPKADSKHFQECETKATTSCRHCINEEKDMVGSESKYCISENKKIHPRANEIKNGLYIESISMRNSTTGRTIWTSKYLVGKDLFAKEFEENIPKDVLSLKMLSREIRFSSVLSLQELRIVQRVFLNGYCIEEWKFHFGFVIPNSINEWTDVIEAAPQILSLQEVSGNVTFETSFFDSDYFICKNVFRIHYV